MDRNDFKNEAKEAIIDCLENGYSGYLCELHNEVFNTDYYETNREKAIEWFDNYEDGVFNIVEEIKNYEQINFGNINTDFSNPCNVLNMFWYIIGDEAFCELIDENNNADIDELWNVELTEEENKFVLKCFKENFNN